MEIYSYGNGLELVLQKHPLRLLSVKQNGEYVTQKYVTYKEFGNNEEAFYIENPETEQTVLFYNYTDEQAERLKVRLQFLNDVSQEIPNLFDLLDEIEEEFKHMHQDYGQEWYSYSRDDRQSFKGKWHATLLLEANVRNVEEVAEKLPQIIKESWLLYSGLKFAWKSIPGWKEIKIFDTWAELIRNAYARKQRQKETTTERTQHQLIGVTAEQHIYQSDIQLIVQRTPEKQLCLKRNEEFVTSKFITSDLLSEDESYFLENSYDGKQIILMNYSDETLENIQNALKHIDERTPQLLDIMEVIEAIEEDFTDRRGLRQEWESSFSDAEQDAIKLTWATTIAKEVDVRDIEKAKKLIPIIVKEGMCQYRGMGHEWDQIDGDIEEEILETWEKLVEEVLSK